LIRGEGVLTYLGEPLVAQPPLYPALLAAQGKFTGFRLLAAARLLNALLYGLTVFLGGMLLRRYLPDQLLTAAAGSLVLTFSIPLFNTAVMAWTEPLFVALTAAALLVFESYRKERRFSSLVLLSALVAIASLTRYIGVVLIGWGAALVLMEMRKEKGLGLHLGLFVSAASGPLLFWLIRNVLASGTLTGPRAASKFSLVENLELTLRSLWRWFLPGKWFGMLSLAALIIVSGLLLGLSFKKSSRSLVEKLKAWLPIILLPGLYGSFLIGASTAAAHDQIGDRLLAPLFLPLIVLLCAGGNELFEHKPNWVPRPALSLLAVLGLTLWLKQPFSAVLHQAQDVRSRGRGYTSADWQDSRWIQFLRTEGRSLGKECALYSNAPDAAYWFTGLEASLSPRERMYHSPVIVNRLSSYHGTWPPERTACLVWFAAVQRGYLFDLNDLNTIAELDPQIQFEDGSWYTVTKETVQPGLESEPPDWGE
jgi:hypothetical protein